MSGRLRPLASSVLIGALLLLAGPTGAGLASGDPVLGSPGLAGPFGKGWGMARPHRIFNGGDPSGLVSEIRWTSWGAGTAHGYGMTSIFKPGGGYYPKLVTAELRAQDLGKCGSRTAYTRLFVREPKRPGGPLGKWFAWAGFKTLCKAG